MNAKWEKEIASISSKAGALESIIHPQEFISDGIFVTKRGFVGGVLRVDPVVAEVLDPQSVRLKCERMEAAIRGIDPEIRLYQYLVKTEVDSLPGRPLSDHTLDDLALAQRRYLQRTCGPLYDVQIYWALVYEGVHRNNRWREMWFPRHGAEIIDAEIRAGAHILEVYLQNLADSMRGSVNAEVLNSEGAFQFLRRLLNYGPEYRGLHLAEPWNLDVQLSRTKIDAVGSLTVGRHHVRVLTMEQAPHPRAHPFTWKGFLDIPCQFIAMTEWKPLPNDKTQRIIQSMKRHFADQLRTTRGTIADFLDRRGTGNVSQRQQERTIDGGKAALVKDLEEAQEEISKKGIYFGDWGLTMALHSEDIDQLRAGVSSVMNTVHQHNAQVSEGLGPAALAAWGSIVPGHKRLNVRRLRIDNSSCSKMSFLFGPALGNERNELLHDEYLSVWLTKQKTPHYFNLHRGQVGHGMMTGVSGAGKTYTLKQMVLDSQKYDPYTVIFDVTGAFRETTESLGGSYLELGRDGGSAKINPFVLPPTAENFDFLVSFVRLLIESDGGSKLNAEETEDLFAQVKSLMLTNLPDAQRRLGNLQPQPHLAPRLARWIGEGQYAWLFDNPVDTLTFCQFQTFSFPNIGSADEEILSSLLYYVLHRTLQAIYETDRPAFVWMDEAVNFLKHPVMRDYIFSALLNWRKQMASLFLVLHSITDLPEETAVTLAQRCQSRIHLSNPDIDIRAWRKLFDLSRAEVNAIRSLVPGRELLVEGAGVMTLRACPELHRALVTGFEKKTRIA